MGLYGWLEPFLIKDTEPVIFYAVNAMAADVLAHYRRQDISRYCI